MTGLSLNTGLKALLSARNVLDTIGHNMANANTPGYSRQRVDLSNSIGLPRGGQYIGSGVDTGAISREVDQLLNGRILTQRGVRGTLDVRLSGLSQFESYLDATGGGTFSGLLDGFFNAASELSTGPGDPILRTGFLQASQDTVSTLNEIASQGDQATRDARAQLEAKVTEANELATEIARLNVDIGSSNRQGVAPNDLLDRRDLMIDELSKIVDVTTVNAPDGTTSVLVSGNMLVSASRAIEMRVANDSSGNPGIRLAASQGTVPIRGGEIGGLLDLASRDLPALRSDFDDFARQLVLATNRIHSTGLPASGPFSVLTGTNSLQDVDQDGKVTDELLSNAGLPFDVSGGGLWVNVQDLSTGSMEKQRIDITASHTTVQDFLDELNAMPHLSADVDSDGRLRMVAEAGYGFDFSARLDTLPDEIGSFGGGRASLNSGQAEPFALADGDTLLLTGDPGGTPVSIQVDFQSADFAEISEATAEEIAAVINANPDVIANGLSASAVGGELVLQTLATGVDADLRVDGGTAVGALGLGSLVGTSVSGGRLSVDATLSGSYTGEADQTFTFRPSGDGSVGTTAGLEVEVYDADGALVTVLDVGAGYAPGTALEVADGVSVAFGLGDLSATHGDVMTSQLVADADTSDVLVALGLNGYFTGSTAGDIAVRQDIREDPDLLATSSTGAVGDSDLLLEMLSMKDARQAEFGGSSLDERYGDIVGGLGFQVSAAEGAVQASDAVLYNLELRRDQVSGVDVDEELVDMVAFEQAYQTAARYISVVSQLSDELLALL